MKIAPLAHDDIRVLACAEMVAIMIAPAQSTFAIGPRMRPRRNPSAYKADA